MTGSFERLYEQINRIAGNWATLSALGTFLLYLCGYLSLRFKLTSLGIETDFYFIDERYLFEGARFIVYIISIVLNLFLVALVLVAIPYAVYRILHVFVPHSWRELAVGALSRLWGWWARPPRLLLAGVLCSLLAIQLLMRKAFILVNLLVGDGSGRVTWLECLPAQQGLTYLYFHGLVLATALPGCLLLASSWMEQESQGMSLLRGGLAFLIIVQMLFLPINFGVLVAREAPAVRSLNGETPLPDGTSAWLVWEGRDGVTYLVEARRERRTLVTLPRDEVVKTEIVGYDNLMKRRFGSACSLAPQKQEEGDT